MTALVAASVVGEQAIGSFLVRFDPSCTSGFIFTMKASANRVLHHHIAHQNGKYEAYYGHMQWSHISGERKPDASFSSLRDLIIHMRRQLMTPYACRVSPYESVFSGLPFTFTNVWDPNIHVEL